jgi:hypothetical protein
VESMASGDSPAVARRRVRLAVREALEAKDITQRQVAEAMEWPLSKVMRIESGEGVRRNHATRRPHHGRPPPNRVLHSLPHVITGRYPSFTYLRSPHRPRYLSWW